MGNKNGTVFRTILSLPPASFLTLPLLILLRFLRPFNQILDLLAAEYLTKKRIILVLLPQGVVLLSEPVCTVDQILFFTIQFPVQLMPQSSGIQGYSFLLSSVSCKYYPQTVSCRGMSIFHQWQKLPLSEQWDGYCRTGLPRHLSDDGFSGHYGG